MIRGVARHTSGDARGAVADYDAAIALREALRDAAGADWTPEQRNNLAVAHLNRGIFFLEAGDLDDALSDAQAACSIWEEP